MNIERLCLCCMREGLTGGKCSLCGEPVPSQQLPHNALPLTTVLHGQYLLGRVLGNGGFGITYIALDLTSGRRVAIKEYMPNGLGSRVAGEKVVRHNDENEFSYGLKRFMQEAQTIHHLAGTPNIIQIEKLFPENQTAYYAMEFLEGCDLKNYLRLHGNRMSFQQTVSMLYPLMMSLDRVHQQGVIHRDIAPDNIFLLKGQNVKLIDFGAAHAALGEKSVSYNVVLKRGYAPAEQYMTNSRQGPWTDVYAMAATIYRCATGQVPPESINRINNKEVVKPLAQMGCSATKQEERVLMRGMAVNLSDRYMSMREFAEDLRRSLPGGLTEVRISEHSTVDRPEPVAPADGTVKLSDNGFSQAPPSKPKGIWRIFGFGKRRAKKQAAAAAAVAPAPFVEPSTESGPDTDVDHRVTRPVAPPPSGAASGQTQYCLLGASGRYAGETIALYSEPLYFGRDQDRCHLIYTAEDRGVSYVHCSVWFDSFQRRVMVEDLGSTYGTFLLADGRKLNAHEPASLAVGESFRLGTQVFTVMKA